MEKMILAQKCICLVNPVIGVRRLLLYWQCSFAGCPILNHPLWVVLRLQVTMCSKVAVFVKYFATKICF